MLVGVRGWALIIHFVLLVERLFERRLKEVGDCLTKYGIYTNIFSGYVHNLSIIAF